MVSRMPKYTCIPAFPSVIYFIETHNLQITRMLCLQRLYMSVSGSYATFDKNTFLIRPILFIFFVLGRIEWVGVSFNLKVGIPTD